MTRFPGIIARRVSALTIVAMVLLLAASGCIVPATVANVDEDTARPTSSDLNPLSPAKVSERNVVELAELIERHEPARPAPTPAMVVAVPLPPQEPKHSISPKAGDTGPPGPESLMRVVPVCAGPLSEPLYPVVTLRPMTMPVAQLQIVPPPAPRIEQPTELVPPIHFATQTVLPPPLPQSPGELPAPANTPPRLFDGELSTAQRIKPLREISLDISAPLLHDDTGARLLPPTDFAANDLPMLAQQKPFVRGELIDYGYDWLPDPVSLDFCYQPLYFEEVNAERYGNSIRVLQPAISTFHFYSRIPLLPYKTFAQPARRCTHQAHWALPGYRIPCLEEREWFPSLDGAAAQSAVAYGMLLLIP